MEWVENPDFQEYGAVFMGEKNYYIRMYGFHQGWVWYWR